MSFPPYSAYKESGFEWLGPVPTHWTVMTVRRVVSRIEQGWSPECWSRQAEGDEWAVLKSGCVNRGVYNEAESKALPSSLDPVPEYEVRPGDVLMSRASGSPELVGSTALVRATRPRIMLSDKIFRVRLESSMDAAFFVAAFNSRYMRVQIEQAISGADGLANNLPQSALRAFVVAVPPPPEQHAITTFLDREIAKIDALVAEQERLIELLREKRQSVISHAVTKGLNPNAQMKNSEVAWLGDVPVSWKVEKLKYRVRRMEQGWSPQCDGGAADPEVDWGVLKVGCVNGGAFRPSENKALPPDLAPMPELSLLRGDLLISRANTRELVGSAAVVPRDYSKLMVCDKLYRLRFSPAETSAWFVARYFGSDVVRRQLELAATGASDSMLNITQSAVLNLPMAAPPYAEQVEIVTYLEGALGTVDALVAEARLASAILQERRAALIFAAVTGKADVRIGGDGGAG